MTDIVKLLKFRQEYDSTIGLSRSTLFGRAAEEIESLHAQLEAVRDFLLTVACGKKDCIGPFVKWTVPTQWKCGQCIKQFNLLETLQPTNLTAREGNTQEQEGD